MIQITNQELRQCLPLSSEVNREKYLPFINKGISKYLNDDIDTVAMFIAQIGHESVQLRYVTELSSGSHYEGRKDLGNIYKGDGVKFKGRGLIQITGRTNYELVSKEFGIDFIRNPMELAYPEWATYASMWWWKMKGLNTVSQVSTAANFRFVTKIINGGYNGWQDRYSLWLNCLKTFNIQILSA